MLRTVLHQTYTRNVAVDASGYSNNGIPVLVTASFPGFNFAQPGSRINVNPSPSLSGLSCINLEVTFKLTPLGATHRYNLAEGFESFALYVNPDFSLSGTIFDATSNWTGASSAPAVVSTGKTHVAALQSDGINMVRILLDGKIVGTNYSVSGQVRSIGALGLAIGHWPNPSNQYAFEGELFEVLLQKYDPTGDLQWIDPCCLDRKGIANWFKSVAQKGATIPKILAAASALQVATRAAAVALRGGDAARTTKHQSLTAALLLALKRHDLTALESVLAQLQQFANTTLDAATRATLAGEIQAALAQLGLGFEDYVRLWSLLCLIPCSEKPAGRNANGR